ncbi:small integral membrane protein 29 isoform X3 [Balearica regulorum gibbericeps]
MYSYDPAEELHESEQELLVEAEDARVGGAGLGGALGTSAPAGGLEVLMLPGELGPIPARRRQERTVSAPALLPSPSAGKGRMRPR